MTTYIATLSLHGRRTPKSTVVKIREQHTSPSVEALINWSNSIARFHQFPIVDSISLSISPAPVGAQTLATTGVE